MIEAVKAQLASLRTQVGSIQAQVVALEEMVAVLDAPPAKAAVCAHLSTTNIGTFGAPDYRCDTCGASVSE